MPPSRLPDLSELIHVKPLNEPVNEPLSGRGDRGVRSSQEEFYYVSTAGSGREGADERPASSPVSGRSGQRSSTSGTAEEKSSPSNPIDPSEATATRASTGNVSDVNPVTMAPWSEAAMTSPPFYESELAEAGTFDNVGATAGAVGGPSPHIDDKAVAKIVAGERVTVRKKGNGSPPARMGSPSPPVGLTPPNSSRVGSRSLGGSASGGPQAGGAINSTVERPMQVHRDAGGSRSWGKLWRSPSPNPPTSVSSPGLAETTKSVFGDGGRSARSFGGESREKRRVGKPEERARLLGKVSGLEKPPVALGEERDSKYGGFDGDIRQPAVAADDRYQGSVLPL